MGSIKRPYILVGVLHAFPVVSKVISRNWNIDQFRRNIWANQIRAYGWQEENLTTQWLRY